MKYPQEQYEVLLNVLKQFAVHVNLSYVGKHTAHFMTYQQLNDGQKHNQLYVNGSVVKRYHQLTDEEKGSYVKLIDLVYNFELYPGGCNDTHITTAMNKAYKDLGIID